jgi:precorrin-2 dehydrogenase / sirohydrochlorin ferrochelatase
VPTSDAPTFAYPVVLDLHDVPVLVVGAGPVGARKVEGLAAAGARVRLVASVVSDTLDRSLVDELVERPYQQADLDGVRLVVTATGDRVVDARVADDARRAGIWVNAADQPADCDLILPAIARAGRLSIAVSTDGASPALARWLRDRCAELLTPDVLAAADVLAAERAAVQASGQSTETVDWHSRLRSLLPELSAQDEHPADVGQTG